MGDIVLSGYVPGAIGRVTELHATYYHQHWGLGLFFEAKVSSELAAFLNRFNPAHDGFWVSMVDERIVGSITIDGSEAAGKGARLRWFIVAPEYHGHGIGKRLMDEAMDFCRRARFQRIYLTTFAGLDAARYLYEKAGFTLTEEHEDATWGKTVLEQKFELALA